MTFFGAAMLDILIVAVIGVSGVLSWLRGFSEELVTLLAWVLSLLAAFYFAEYAAQFVPASLDELTLGGRSYGLTPWHAPVAGLGIFIVTFILVSQLHRVLSSLLQGRVLHSGDRGLGLLFGLVRGAIVVLVLVLLAGTTPVPAADFWQQSRLTPYFVQASEQVIEWMPERWRGFFDYPEPPPAT